MTTSKRKAAEDQSAGEEQPSKKGTSMQKIVAQSDEITMESISIRKPTSSSLERFRSKRSPTIAGVKQLATGLAVLKIAEANDFVRVHPDEANYWSEELCFVGVQIKGAKQDTLHLIDEDVAMRWLPAKKIERFRLALATKPDDVFFLCRVPPLTDSTWNQSALAAIEQAKTLWTQATSRRSEGIEAYKADFAEDADAFPEPKWPEHSLEDYINQTFAGRMISDDNHPVMLRLRGAKQKI
jgi:hypothetical protein